MKANDFLTRHTSGWGVIRAHIAFEPGAAVGRPGELRHDDNDYFVVAGPCHPVMARSMCRTPSRSRTSTAMAHPICSSPRLSTRARETTRVSRRYTWATPLRRAPTNRARPTPIRALTLRASPSLNLSTTTGAGTDLVVSNFGSGTASVFLHDPANAGKYLAATTLTTGGQPNQVVSADLNGDGRPDLVFADLSTSGNAMVMLQDAAHPDNSCAR